MFILFSICLETRGNASRSAYLIELFSAPLSIRRKCRLV